MISAFSVVTMRIFPFNILRRNVLLLLFFLPTSVLLHVFINIYTTFPSISRAWVDIFPFIYSYLVPTDLFSLQTSIHFFCFPLCSLLLVSGLYDFFSTKLCTNLFLYFLFKSKASTNIYATRYHWSKLYTFQCIVSVTPHNLQQAHFYVRVCLLKKLLY